jgi:hypothetical protein
MILRISVNLVKFCVSEVGEFWWRFFYFAWRKRGGGERGVVDGTVCNNEMDRDEKAKEKQCAYCGKKLD